MPLSFLLTGSVFSGIRLSKKSSLHKSHFLMRSQRNARMLTSQRKIRFLLPYVFIVYHNGHKMSMGLQKIFGLIHENGKERKSEKIFCAQNRFFYILYEKRKEISHMKNKTFILLAAVVCLISVTLAACAGCASEQGEAEVTTPQSTETTRSTPYFGVFEAERGNSFYIDIGGVPLDVIGDGGKTATKFQMEYSVEDEQVAEIVAIEGNRIYMRAKSTGTTLLIARTCDGQTAYAKIFVRHIPQTTTTACTGE